MRTHFFVFIALSTALGGCGSSRNSTESQQAPVGTPSPLRACETRELTLDDTDMILQANIDGTPASITIVHARDTDSQDKAVEEARKLFGAPHPDTRTMTHQSKWGILEITDACGRPVTPPSATPSPG